MKGIIGWLAGIENISARIYEKAAFRFKDDKKLAEFLIGLGEEEKAHQEIIHRAFELTKERVDPPSLRYPNNKRQYLENYLLFLLNRLDSQAMTKERLLYYIVAIESAEFNDLFVRLFDNLKGGFSEFMPMAVRIAQHKRSIELFVRSQHPPAELLKRLDGLYPVL